MAERRIGAGPLVVLLGAAMTAVAPWLHWYRVDLTDQFREAFRARGGPFGDALGNAFAEGFGRMFDGLVPHSIAGTGWQVLHTMDIVLFAGAIVVGLTVLVGTGLVAEGVNLDGVTAARLARFAGVALGAVVIYTMVDRTGPHELVKLGLGPWVALGGCALMVVGGMVGPPARHFAEPTTITVPIAPAGASSMGSPTASVGPPRH